MNCSTCWIKARCRAVCCIWLSLPTWCAARIKPAAGLQKLRQAGCRVIFSQVGRDMNVFTHLTANMADYLMLDAEVVSNVHGNLMDEMMVTIIQGHAQRLG
jgi:EAL domain-containing protein (putative c-di-GMP-specific phosphodiesterase class I)